MKATQFYYKLKQLYDLDQGKTLDNMDMNVIVNHEGDENDEMLEAFDFKTDSKSVINIHAKSL